MHETQIKLPTLAGLKTDLLAINRIARSGNPIKLRLAWKKARTLSQLASHAESSQAKPPARRVAGILAQLAQRAEAK